MENYATAPDGASTLFESQSPPCEHCGTAFARREGNGGKPQRFCSTKCRTSFHRQTEVPNVTNVTSVGGPASEAAASTPEPTKTAQEAAEAKLAAILAKQEEERFDWFTDDSVVLEKQLSIAVYLNARHHLVIRQEAEYPDEDSVILVAPQNIREFIVRLCDVAGIPTAGAP
jgi:hypothetical protein